MIKAVLLLTIPTSVPQSLSSPCNVNLTNINFDILYTKYNAVLGGGGSKINDHVKSESAFVLLIGHMGRMNRNKTDTIICYQREHLSLIKRSGARMTL